MSARTPLSALFDRVSVLDREQNLGPLRAVMAALAAAPDVDDGLAARPERSRVKARGALRLRIFMCPASSGRGPRHLHPREAR